MKKYFVQTRSPDGEISLSVNTEQQILEMVGFRDCTDCDYEVFAADEFGKVANLLYWPATSAPFNYHRFYNPQTEKMEFSGYSTEH